MSGFAQDVWAAWQSRQHGQRLHGAARARSPAVPAAAPDATLLLAPPVAPLVATAAAMPEPSSLPPRQWLYGTRYVHRFVSVLVAPGGVGKSALALGQAVAVASGQPILGERVHHAAPAWVLNLEDPGEETDRRLAALMRLHAIPREALSGKLFVHSGRGRRVVIAELDAGAVVRHPDREAVIAAALAAGIGFIVVDPFVKSHRVDENSNGQIDAAATAWAEVAEATGAAVLLVHHVRKGAQADVEAARGAKSLTDAARSAALLQPMTVEEAERLGVPADERWRHIRLDDAKANLAPRLAAASAAAALWYRLQTVALDNGTAAYPNGDQVAAIALWRPDASRPIASHMSASHVDASRPIASHISASHVDAGGNDRASASRGGRGVEIDRAGRGAGLDRAGRGADGGRGLGDGPGCAPGTRGATGRPAALPEASEPARRPEPMAPPDPVEAEPPPLLDAQAAAAALARIAAGCAGGLPWNAQRGPMPRHGRDRWAGRVLVEACALTEDEAAAAIADWLRRGVLVAHGYRDPVQRKPRVGVRPGPASHAITDGASARDAGARDAIARDDCAGNAGARDHSLRDDCAGNAGARGAGKRDASPRSEIAPHDGTRAAGTHDPSARDAGTRHEIARDAAKVERGA